MCNSRQEQKTTNQRTARVGAVSLDLLDKVHALDDLAEDDVLAVQPWGLDGGDL
jgi:hypothetical protein